MRNRLWTIVLALTLCGCGQNEALNPDVVPGEYSFEGTVFYYEGQEYDLNQRENAIYEIWEATPVGKNILVVSNLSPRANFYSVFNTETREFERDMAGTNLIWQGDDLSTCLYVGWPGADIWNYDGNMVAGFDLQTRSEFIREIRFSDEPGMLDVEIVTETGRYIEQISLEGETQNDL